MLAYEVIDDIFLGYHDAEAPTDEQWDGAMRAIEDCRSSHLRVLIVTLGGASSPPQQLRIARMKQKKTLTIAVVSSSVGIRFVASSLALFTRHIRTFAPQELKRAYDFLDMTEAHAQRADRFFASYRLS